MPDDYRLLRRTELPADFGDALRGLSSDGNAPETLADAVDALDRLWADANVTVRQLFQPDGSRHVVDFGDRTEFVPCVLDAVIAAFAVGADPVEIRSTEPHTDATVRLTVTDDTVSAEPPTAVFSFGVNAEEVSDPNLSVPEGTDSVVMAFCSYINAFRDPTAYEAWQHRLTDACAVEIDVETLSAVAAIAAEEWVTAEPM